MPGRSRRWWPARTPAASTPSDREAPQPVGYDGWVRPRAPRRTGRDARRTERGQGRLGGRWALFRIGLDERDEQGPERTAGQVSWSSRQVTGEQLGSREASREEVVPRVGRGAGSAFGREVAGRAAGLGLALVADAEQRGEVEVAEPQVGPPVARRLEQEVRGFHIAVDQPGCVQRGQGLEQLVEQDRQVALRQRAVLGEELVGGAAADQPHRHRRDDSIGEQVVR